MLKDVSYLALTMVLFFFLNVHVQAQSETKVMINKIRKEAKEQTILRFQDALKNALQTAETYKQKACVLDQGPSGIRDILDALEKAQGNLKSGVFISENNSLSVRSVTLQKMRNQLQLDIEPVLKNRLEDIKSCIS